MNALKGLVIVLGVAVIALGISLAVVLARDDGGDSSSSATSDATVSAMLSAMQSGDWQGMQQYMRQYMGDDAYQGMMGWWNAGPTPSSSATSDDVTAGMIGAMRAGDWNSMFEYMRQYMGEDAYQQMMGWHMSCMTGSTGMPMMSNGYACPAWFSATPTPAP